MCDEHVEFWSSSERVARKWHKCFECEGLIAPGDIYVRQVTIDRGCKPETVNRHVPCEAIAEIGADDGEGCRMLGEQAEYFIREWSYEAEARSMLATLRWMNVRSRLRFARQLAQAWGGT